MSYPYFFIGPGYNIVEGKIIIKGKDLNHLANVLRVKKGDFVEVSDNTNYRYQTTVLNISKSEAVLYIKDKTKIERKLPEIVLFLCILKKNAMEFAIQKTTEIGVDEIIPVFSKRVVLDKTLDLKKMEEKLSRWQKIAEESSKQCKRDFIPKISKPVNIDEIVVSEYGMFYLPYEVGEVGEKKVRREEEKVRKEDGKDFLKELLDRIGDLDTPGKKNGKIAYIIGPEGGFEEKEASLLEDRGGLRLNLGKNILRSETAAVYFLSVLDFIVRKSMKL